MKVPRLEYIDRLTEHSWFEKYGFLAVAGAGAIVIWMSKSLGLQHELVALLAVIIMGGYAYLVSRTGSGRLRSDHAGDNCYYLGLIFTLTSLAYAIFTFDPNDTATTIVQGFGIALATTILGLVLRVFFNQSRTDLVEIEKSARLDLVKAAGELKSELSQSVVSMNDFSHQTKQSLNELRDNITSEVSEMVKKTVKSVDKVLATSQSGVEQRFDQLSEHMNSLDAAVKHVIEALEEHRKSIVNRNSASNALADQITSFNKLAESASIALEQLSEQAKGVAAIQTATEGSVNSLNSTVGDLSRTIASIEDASGKFHSEMLLRLETMENAPVEAVKATTDALTDAAQTMRNELEKMQEAHKDTIDLLSDQIREAAQMAAKHNQSLEADLAHSRTNLGKVHSALVDMTEGLANRLDGVA